MARSRRFQAAFEYFKTESQMRKEICDFQMNNEYLQCLTYKLPFDFAGTHDKLGCSGKMCCNKNHLLTAILGVSETLLWSLWSNSGLCAQQRICTQRAKANRREYSTSSSTFSSSSAWSAPNANLKLKTWPSLVPISQFVHDLQVILNRQDCFNYSINFLSPINWFSETL